MRTRQMSAGGRGSILVRLLVTLLVAGLTAAVVFLLSERNAHTYGLEQDDGQLVVVKGRMFPVGMMPYRPSDPALADAYAPIDLHGHSPGPLTDQTFSERDELDRALFSLLESIARPRVTSDDPKDLELGVALLQRMDKLSGITEDQRRTLRSLQAEVAYYEARVRLDDARKDIAESLAELKLAGDSSSHNARSAQQMIMQVEPAAKALEEALRRAVHELSAPAPTGSTSSPSSANAGAAAPSPSPEPASPEAPPAADPAPPPSTDAAQ